MKYVMMEGTQEVFHKVNPICVKLAREHKVEHVEQLSCILQNTPSEALQDLQEYIIFPLRLIIKQSREKKENLYLEVFKCLTVALSKTEIVNFALFQDLFTSLCLFLGKPEQTVISSTIAEEVKLECILCLKQLIKCTKTSVLESVYVGEFLPPLGHAISILLHLAQNEQLRSLRKESMLCIQTLALVDTQLHYPLNVKLGNTFASFLPGITMAMAKIATGDVKQGQEVTVTALKTWQMVTLLVMSDNNLDMVNGKQSTDVTVKDERLKNLLVDRSSNWVTETASKVEILVKKIVSLVNHNNWKVRLALAQCASNILLKCGKSLKGCSPLVLEVLVTLTADDFSKVSSSSQSALEEYKLVHESEHSTPLVEILLENLHKMATTLPRLMRSLDEQEKQSTLNLFSGYLKLLGSETNTLLQSAPHLQRVSLALLQVLEMDCSHVKIIAERAEAMSFNQMEMDAENLLYPRKPFIHLSEDKTLQQVRNVCRLLGYYGDTELLVDHFLDLFHQSALHRKQAIFCINEIVLGMSGCGVTGNKLAATEEYMEIIRMLLSVYLLRENFDLPTTNQKTITTRKTFADELFVTPEETSLGIQKLNSNILQTCLLLEGIAAFAKVLGDRFDLLLVDTFYPVLEKLGHETSMISHTARITLKYMSVASQTRSLVELIENNHDYLVTSISLRLRNLDTYPRTPEVLKVVLMHSSANILPLIWLSVEQIIQALDEHYDSYAVNFMNVLLVLMQAINQWYPPVIHEIGKRESEFALFKKHPKNEQTRELNDVIKAVKDYVNDYVNHKNLAEGDFIDHNPSENVEQVNDQEEMYMTEEKEKLVHIKIAKQVLERCSHFLPSSNFQLQLLTLHCLEESTKALHGERDDLLPLLHKVWPSFAARICHTNLLVTTQALRTLAVITSHSGDFLRQRITKEILPKLPSLLKQHFVSCPGAGYKFTQSYKVQLTLLQNLGSICKQADIEGHSFTNLISGICLLTNQNQPETIVRAACECLKELQDIDSDIVWLEMLSLGYYQLPTSYSNEFKEYSLNRIAKPNVIVDR